MKVKAKRDFTMGGSRYEKGQVFEVNDAFATRLETEGHVEVSGFTEKETAPGKPLKAPDNNLLNEPVSSEPDEILTETVETEPAPGDEEKSKKKRGKK